MSLQEEYRSTETLQQQIKTFFSGITNDLKDAIEEELAKDEIYKAGVRKTPGSTTSVNADDEDGVVKYFEDLIGSSQSVIADVQEAAMSIDGWINSLTNQLTQFESNVQSEAEKLFDKGVAIGTGALSEGINNATQGLKEGVQNLSTTSKSTSQSAPRTTYATGLLANNQSQSTIRNQNVTLPNFPSFGLENLENIFTANVLDFGLDNLDSNTQLAAALDNAKSVIQNNDPATLLIDELGTGFISSLNIVSGEFSQSMQNQIDTFIKQSVSYFDTVSTNLSRFERVLQDVQEIINSIGEPVEVKNFALDLINELGFDIPLSIIEEEKEAISIVYNAPLTDNEANAFIESA